MVSSRTRDHTWVPCIAGRFFTSWSTGKTCIVYSKKPLKGRFNMSKIMLHCKFCMSKCSLKSESEVAQSCPALCDPMDCSLPGSSLHGIFQARVLEWVAISFSRGSSQSKDRTRVSCIPGRCFNLWATRSNRQIWLRSAKLSRAKANRVLPREHTGYRKHSPPTTQETTLHRDITRWSVLKWDWLYSWQP